MTEELSYEDMVEIRMEAMSEAIHLQGNMCYVGFPITSIAKIIEDYIIKGKIEEKKSNG